MNQTKNKLTVCMFLTIGTLTCGQGFGMDMEDPYVPDAPGVDAQAPLCIKWHDDWHERQQEQERHEQIPAVYGGLAVDVDDFDAAGACDARVPVAPRRGPLRVFRPNQGGADARRRVRVLGGVREPVAIAPKRRRDVSPGASDGRGHDEMSGDEGARQRVLPNPSAGSYAARRFFEVFAEEHCAPCMTDGMGMSTVHVERITLSFEERIILWIQRVAQDRASAEREIARFRAAIDRLRTFIAARSVGETGQVGRLLALGQAIHAHCHDEARLWELFINIVEQSPEIFGDGVVHEATALAYFIDLCCVIFLLTGRAMYVPVAEHGIVMTPQGHEAMRRLCASHPGVWQGICAPYLAIAR